MAGVLEQEEIDALMGGLSSGELDTDTESGVGAEEGDDGQSRQYDFSKQHYAIRRLLPAVAAAHAQFAEAIQEKVGKLAPGIDAVTPEDPAVTSFAELLPRLATPCRLAVIEAPPLAAPIYLAFESDLVFDMVNRYFGGHGGLRKTRASERFSPTETRLTDVLGGELLVDLAESWRSFLEIVPSIREWENEPRFVDDLSASDTLIVHRFRLTFGDSQPGLWMIIPWAAIDPVRDRLGGIARHSKRERDPEWHQKMLKGLEDTDLELVAVLAQTRVKLKRAMQLKKGDIIAINEPRFINLQVDSIPLLRASFGTHDGQLAAKVESTLRSPPRGNGK